MAAVEATAPLLERPQDDSKFVSADGDDPKAALKKTLVQDGEADDQVLFSCNICYEVSAILLLIYGVLVILITVECSTVNRNPR
jgi:hypothetical protein